MRWLPILTMSLVLLFGCGREEDQVEGAKGNVSGELIIFHAGSLAVPFEKIAEAFMKEYPGVKVLREAAGSRTCARKISELGRPCDVMASADYTVIDTLLIPEHAEWNIPFATNEMAIVYHDSSRRADEISRKNWPSILLDPDVAYGRSDPNADPCGYRAVLTMRLAETYYDRAGLAERLMQKDRRHIRPKETDLLALLEAGEIDYLFLYRSVGEQHGLKCLLLPDEINLKTPRFADRYAQVSVEISGKKPGETITRTGAPMLYGVTIPKNAPNRQAALLFLEFLLEKQNGMKVMESCGQPSAVPSRTATYEKLPEELKPFAARPEE